MLDFQQKRKLRAVMYHKVTLALLVLLVLFFIHSTWVVYQKKRTSEKMMLTSSQSLSDLKARETELESRINRLNTPAGLEEEIRSKFTVAKENEAMVIVVDDNSQNMPTTSQKRGFWQKIWNLFSR